MPPTGPSVLPLVLFFGVIPLALLAYCLYDAIPAKFPGKSKVFWITIAIVLPVLGPLMYLFVGKDKKLKGR